MKSDRLRIRDSPRTAWPLRPAARRGSRAAPDRAILRRWGTV